MRRYFEVVKLKTPNLKNPGIEALFLFGLKITQKSAFLVDFQNFYFNVIY